MTEIKAYKSFRLLITKSSSSKGASYCSITEWQMWEDEDDDDRSLDFLHGGIASARYTDGPYTPINAIDGNTASHWSSRSSDDAETWLRVDLDKPKVARRLFIKSSRDPNFAPENFKLQGSNDGGATWDDIAKFVNFLKTTGEKTIILSRMFSGRAILPDGQPASRVSIHRWDNLTHVVTLTPDSNGYWHWLPTAKLDYLVTFFGPTGYRPIAEGPVAAPLIEG